jgi:phosphatidylglycerol:prolipoprotein diacylglycerol transferase
MYLFAFGTGYLLFTYQVRERGLKIPKDDITNFSFWTILGLLLGARILAALVYDTSGKYLANPLLIFWPFDSKFRFTGLQGMSYHGGLLGAVAGAVLYTRKKKYDTLEWGDMLVAGIPLGYTFGRLGNFINGELYGRVTSAPWGMYFAHARKFSPKEPWVAEIAARAGIPITNPNALINLPRHPSQLYEAFFEGIFLWAILWFLVRNRNHFKGFVIGAYIIGYGTVRFFIEYFREPDQGIEFPIRLSSLENPPYLLVTPWNFTIGQILCLLMILGGAAALVVFHRLDRKRRAGRTGTEEKGAPKVRSLRKLHKKLK